MKYENVEVNSKRWFDLKPLLNEEFRDIKGYEGLYQVSNYGRIKSIRNNIILKTVPNTYGYPTVVLSNAKKKGNTNNTYSSCESIYSKLGNETNG